MPMNAPQYYYVLAEKYRLTKDLDEKEKILQEMISVLPKHKGSEKELAMLKRRLSLLRKSGKKKTIRLPTIKKTWPRVCLIGYEKPKDIKFTEIGGVYYGVEIIDGMHIQVVLMSSKDKNKDAFNSSDIIISKEPIETRGFNVVQTEPDVSSAIKEYGVIPVYLNTSQYAIPVKAGKTIKDLMERTHIPIKKGAYALIETNDGTRKRTGLEHVLEVGERVILI